MSMTFISAIFVGFGCQGKFPNRILEPISVQTSEACGSQVF